MGKSNSEREALLIESFDILKNNVEKNELKISEIIGKMAGINVDVAVEMWKYFIQNAKHLIKEDGYSYTESVMYIIESKTSTEKLIKILNENDDLVELSFGVSNSIYAVAVSDALKYGEFELADRILSLISRNRYKEENFSYYLEQISELFADEFEEIQNFDEEWDDIEEHDHKVKLARLGSELLLKWVSKIQNKESNARLKVTLIDYV